jgi:O-antigen ligase
MTGDPQKQPELTGTPEALFSAAFLQRLEILTAIAYAVSLPLSMTLSWVLLVGGLVLAAASTVAGGLAGARKAWTTFEQAPLCLPLLALALALTISGAFNGGLVPGQPDAQSLSSAWASLCSLKSLIPYFWAYSIFQRSRSCAVTSVILLLWVSALAGVWGAIQQLFHFHPFTYPYEQGTGFLFHPMAFAGQMQLFSMLALGLLLSLSYKTAGEYCPHPCLKKLFDLTGRSDVFAVIVAANFAGLFFAGERSAWAGGFAGVVAVTLLKSWRFALKSLLGLSGAALLSYLAVPLVRSRIGAIFSGHDVSISVRTRIWGDCLHVHFPHSPLFGVGIMNFPHFNIPEAIVPGVSKDLNHAHSNYIHILTTTGIIGLAAYLFLLLATFKAALAKFRSCLSADDRFGAGAAMGIFGAAVSLAVAGIFEFNFGTAQLRLAQWFLFALL